jgi:hypothetical protein
MADKYSAEELKAKMKASGWRLVRDKEAPITGTLQNLVHLTHQRHSQGETPGLIQEIETRIERDMIESERLWLSLGLPV